MFDLQYISNHQIDKLKWDQCIDESTNGLIYAYSWYLDTMSEHWDALVLNDYETVMPITWKKKYGIHYLYQPWFCASLGIFSKKELSASLIASFLKAVPSKFRYWDIYLNSNNLFEVNGFTVKERTNYILPLKESYESISNKYRNNLKRNIKKAEASGFQLKKDITVDEVLQLARNIQQSLSDISDKELFQFKHVYQQAAQKNKAETYGLYLNNNLLASAAFLFSHHRWYYILVGNHPDGKTLGASHFLIDRFIYNHAGEDATLDFEGSDIRNLAFFYSSYGAREEKYAAIRMNRLPKIIQWLKN